MIGIRDVKTSERMQLKSELTLEEATTMARQAEMQNKQNKLIRGNDTESAEVCKVNASRDARNQEKIQRSQSSRRNMEKDRDKCSRCGLPRHEEGRRCPAINTTVAGAARRSATGRGCGGQKPSIRKRPARG